MDKYLSVITNFGCHYKCPYCIVKNNNLHIPVSTIEGLDKLPEELKMHNATIISISGGGDPLYEYEKHIDWYRKFFSITQKYYIDSCLSTRRTIPVEMHTSYMTNETSFPFYDCYRVVYHPNTLEQLSNIHRIGNELVRVVFVVTKDFTVEDIMKIAVHNDSDECALIRDKDRIAQLVIVPYVTVDLHEVEELSDTNRGDNGFGSTGK